MLKVPCLYYIVENRAWKPQRPRMDLAFTFMCLRMSSISLAYFLSFLKNGFGFTYLPGLVLILCRKNRRATPLATSSEATRKPLIIFMARSWKIEGA